MGQKFEVFRVEDRNNEGPYRSNISCYLYKMLKEHVKREKDTPIPEEDITGWLVLNKESQSEFSFGFQSLNQLHSWFYDVLSDLFNEGYFIVKYEVDKDDILFGQKQVAFRKPTK